MGRTVPAEIVERFELVRLGRRSHHDGPRLQVVGECQGLAAGGIVGDAGSDEVEAIRRQPRKQVGERSDHDLHPHAHLLGQRGEQVDVETDHVLGLGIDVVERRILVLDAHPDHAGGFVLFRERRFLREGGTCREGRDTDQSGSRRAAQERLSHTPHRLLPILVFFIRLRSLTGKGEGEAVQALSSRDGPDGRTRRFEIAEPLTVGWNPRLSA